MYTINTKKGTEYYFVPISSKATASEFQYFQDYADKALQYEKVETWVRNYIKSTTFPKNYDDSLKTTKALIEYANRVDKNFDINDYFRYEENLTTLLASSVLSNYAERTVSKVKADGE
jgi:hypothetical protein